MSADDYRHCETLVRDADKDRFLSALFAPAARRDALFALYAFHVEITRIPLLAREPFGEVDVEGDHADRVDDGEQGDQGFVDVHGVIL